MTNEKLLEELNKIANITDKLIASVIAEDKTLKKNKKKVKTDPKADVITTEETIALVHNNLIKCCFPTDKEFIEDVSKVVTTNNISVEDLEKCLERVKIANDKEPKNDIKKYIFSCLYKIDRA